MKRAISFFSLFFCLSWSLTVSAQTLSPDNNPEYHRLAGFKTLINQQFDHSRPIVRYILEELESRQLPSSLAFVPMLESSFQPDAVSPANAAGLWQLMPATAQRYGLTVNQHKDERFNLSRSTHAAISYLAFLYQKFHHNLSLTLAAYNAGEGRVERSLQENKRFTELKLPEETIRYVHRFHALLDLVDLSRFSSGSHSMSPIIRLNNTAAAPLIPMQTRETQRLQQLFAKRTTINTDHIQPLVRLNL
ncbi:lytic transglycosylase [Vibrio albus]|uniref:Lytic transglycosylase n=1 Tax=Vibrio albus TaxID=2200953 RepID=A0A2U3B8A5_9VIBR|nr:lytic transglycosylase domain-containing protein [Vibrio albus]PWI32997.1 lytic transglycosylase [Vibrio albus]